MNKNKTRWYGLLLAALALLIFLLSQTPARLLGPALAQQGINVASWYGTLWQGRAERVVLRAPQGDWHLGTVSWHVRLASLWRLRPVIAVESQWETQRISALVTWQGPNALLLETVNAQLPTAVLSVWLPMDVQGTFSIDLERLYWRGDRLDSAQGRVVWDNASWRGAAGRYELGRYVLELSDQGSGSVAGRVLTLSGPVQAEGEAQLNEGRRYGLRLAIGPRGRLPEELEQALSLIAAPQEDVWSLQLNGAW